jgi:hypothetical protein
MSTYKMILTNYGRDVIAEAAVTKTPVKLIQMGAGDSSGNYYEPTPEQTNLRNEIWRGDINDLYSVDNIYGDILAEAVIPPDAAPPGGWFVREVGVYDNKNGLIAVGSYPLVEQPDLLSGSARQIYIKVVIQVDNVAAIELVIDHGIVLVTKAELDELKGPDGAGKTLSQIATSYQLDYALGGVWHEGADSVAKNWWFYKNKIWTGGNGALPTEPAAPWYPIRAGHKLHIDDFIISTGSSEITDVIGWQWAFDSALANAEYSSIIEMGPREYTCSDTNLVMHTGVSMRGPQSAMMAQNLDGCTVIYIDTAPAGNENIFTLRGHNLIENVGHFYSRQVYSKLTEMIDVGVLYRKIPESSAANTKACTLRGVSVCGGSKIWYGSYAQNAASEYDVIKEVAVTPSIYGPSFRYGLSTDMLRNESIHVNANVVSMYRSKYNVEISERGIPSSYVNAIAFLIERMDGGTFHDILTYGVPYGVVFGAVGNPGGTQGASANFVSCAWDATCYPIYVNCPTGAFGIQLSNCQAVFVTTFGDKYGALIYVGDSATEHQLQISNFKVQMTSDFAYRPVRATSGSSYNRVSMVNCALSGASEVLDEGTGNRVSGLQLTRNLGLINFQTNLTPEATLMSSLGELNTFLCQDVAVNVPAGATYVSVNIDFERLGWLQPPRIIPVPGSAAIVGQHDSTVYTPRVYSITTTGCVLRLILSSAAVEAGIVVVNLFIVGTVRGVLR